MGDQMQILYFEVHSFTDEVFHGNPAGVCPLEEWLDDEMMLKIAAENGLSETAFFVAREGFYELRWFTPTTEVDLCGHATLATAFVLFEHLGYDAEAIRFETKSGALQVGRLGASLIMDFPSRPGEECSAPDHLASGLGIPVKEVYKSRDYLVVLPDEDVVRALDPDFSELLQVDALGIIVTAPGDDVDFVSRFFAPRAGVNEDPVTGSAHCTLAPYWAERLEKKDLSARQVSDRGGELACRIVEDRVHIAGHAVLYFKGVLSVE